MTRLLVTAALCLGVAACSVEIPEATPTPTPTPRIEESYAVGSYRFTGVQILEDSGGYFLLRTRATNEGPARDGVSFLATIFLDDSIVGTAVGRHDNWEAGQTVTLELWSATDLYTAWNEVDFQVQTEQ